MNLRIGVIGCGEVTQILHLPSLRQLAAQFSVTALCDVSRNVLEGVGEGWPNAARVLDYQAVLARDDVDAVLVASPHAYHSEVALAALTAGKHVLVEKPLCLTLREADALTAAQEKTGLVVQVGTMRRYADAFVQATGFVRALPAVKLARVHAVIGDNRLFIQGTSRVLRGDDVPAEVLSAGRALEHDLLAEATNSYDPALHAAYLTLAQLSVHDLSAMRELLGMPERVLYAASRDGGTYFTAAFDYGDFICHFKRA